jgi:tetratricopeptide (TPR) repeat protein
LITQLRSNLSLAYLKTKQFDECVKTANLVLESGQGSAKMLHRRAVAETELGYYDRAREDLQRGLELEPGNAEIVKELENLNRREKK